MKQYIFYIFILFSIIGFSQGFPVKQIDTLPVTEIDSLYVKGDYIIYEGDTLTINLNEVQLLQKLKFDNNNDKRYYFWFRRKVLKAYPFAKLASERLMVLNERIENIKSKRKKKRYIKMVQKFMEEEFTDQLKKLTRTEGRILIKLIHRQTGETVFSLIKDYRSGWNAFWYNSTASVFKLSLKAKYDPNTIKEDYLIEDILQRAFVGGYLEEQKPKLNFDFYSIDPTTLNNKN